MTTDTVAPDYRSWTDFHRAPALITSRRALLNEKTKVFTMGSCFAAEVRRALIDKGFDVYPKYAAIAFDRTSQMFDKLPSRDFVAHYDTFAIRQEFEAAFAMFPDRAQGFYPVENTLANKHLNAPVVYQDPYRKRTYAVDLPLLTDLADKISKLLYNGIAAADLMVITLGLTEVWQHKVTGRYFCRPPGTGYGGGGGLARFRQSTFSENYENLRATLDLLFRHFPGKQVVLSVSPVPLQQTYSVNDVGTANLESKCILRAVAGQICREYAQNVSYLPSYEMATIIPGRVFQEDGRHVLPEFANSVIDTFTRIYGKTE